MGTALRESKKTKGRRDFSPREKMKESKKVHWQGINQEIEKGLMQDRYSERLEKVPGGRRRIKLHRLSRLTNETHEEGEKTWGKDEFQTGNRFLGSGGAACLTPIDKGGAETG